MTGNDGVQNTRQEALSVRHYAFGVWLILQLQIRLHLFIVIPVYILGLPGIGAAGDQDVTVLLDFFIALRIYERAGVNIGV